MGKGVFTGPLEQVDACCYRIPKSFRADMRVDGLIFANDKLIQSIRNDQAPEQVANVATLPGIQGASLAMPDIHWGYGFCIGGVCATDPAEGGVISPGGVGYDINCLPADAEVMHRFGYTRRIGDMIDAWKTAELSCMGLSAGKRTSTGAHRWFAQAPKAPVLELKTTSGDTLRGTADHPVWTPDGMTPLGQLKPGDRVAVTGFRGVPFEEPSNEVIVSERQLRDWFEQSGRPNGGNAVGQAVDYLAERGLLPLRYSSAALPVLCKVAGFLFGDGSVHFESGGKGLASFYGDAADLESIRADLTGIGVTPSRVYTRHREHEITTAYDTYTFERDETHFKVSSTAFAALLSCLGVPAGKKPSQDYDAPAWLDAAPLWMKRCFLAALFGAELSKPATMTGHPKVFPAAVLSLNKRPAHVESGRRFLQTLSRWLAEFGVETQDIPRRDEQLNEDGERSVRLRLILSSKADSLSNLWGRVGFEYHRERARLAGLAVQYVKHAERVRADVILCPGGAEEVSQGWSERSERNPWNLGQFSQAPEGRQLVCRPFGTQVMGTADQGFRRFAPSPLANISRPSGAKSCTELPDTFPTFAEFCAKHSDGDLIWEAVESISEVRDFTGKVYDFTVDHPDHNFIANGFVVSNCGVRLCKTNLFLDDVTHHIRGLVKALFETVPSGVGRTGKYKFDAKETRRLMGEGASFAVGRDLGVPRDLANIEANGRIDGGDPDEVTDHAVKRGSQQCGTLGSGNHFLEVQVVEHIADAEVAAAFGLELNQVCVMIHSGSRGLGYQVCDDALAAFRDAPKKYGIVLPDRQLACAPADSPEGRKYIAAMRAAANFGFCNRQLLMHQAREVFAEVFGRSWEDLGMELLYDVAHNIAKLEEHTVEGKKKMVWVHRKGATRAFPAGHPELPRQFQKTGQPVIIPGDMGRASWVLAGAPGSMARTFGSTCHGAGRAMSRTAALKDGIGRRIDKELEARGVIAMSASRQGLAEEQPKAYKLVDDVVDVVHEAGLSTKVARMRPIGVIKG